MDEEKMYCLNHTNNNETLYYQQQHPDVLPTTSESLSHSFGTPSMDSCQSSPLSPHFPQDDRYSSVLAMCAKDFGLLDSYRKTIWTQPESSKPMQLINSQSNHNITWNSPGQGESDDFHYASSPQLGETRSQDVTRGNFHKLDSFSEVFSTHNLRIQANSMPHGLHSQSSLTDHASDSALRQLLSQKPAAEQTSVHPNRQRYQQVPQHVHQSFVNTQQKHQMDVDNHQQQQPFYFSYPQQVSQMQQQGQCMQANQMPPQQMQQMQQSSYYLQPHPQEQQCHSLQEIQQQAIQTQLPVQISQYYQTQTVMQQIQHVLQLQQQPMQLQPPSYQRELNQNISQESHQYSYDQTNPLRAATQYFYQNSQNLNNYCHQSLLHQQKQYHNDFGSQLFLGPQANLRKSEFKEKQAKQHCHFLETQSLSPQPVSPTTITSGKQQVSANSMWPQISQPGCRLQMVSPEESVQHKRPATEKCGIKSRMTCSVCSKEFKSLPALNGHMRSHGGMRASPIYKQDEEEKPQRPKEVEHLTPIIMPVSVPVKLPPVESSIQASSKLVKGNPANTMPDDEMPILTRMTRSPPCSSKAPSPITSSETIIKYPSCTTLENSEENNTRQEKKKYRHRPDPLFIPPPTFSFSMSHTGATLYQSQLRSPCIMGDHLLVKSQELPPYTPPPMLSPVRQGSGLFSSVITAHSSAVYSQLPPTPLTPTPRVLLFRNSLDGGNVPVTPGPGEQTIDIEPRINIGSKFQAQIPDLQSQSVLKKEVHKATLVWKPITVLEKQECLQRVKDFLNMSCSSVLPGGGTNLEYALHCLFEVEGDMMRALEMLLLKRKYRSKRHPLANYHYAGSDRWTSQERKLFNKAVANTNKDLFHVHKMVNSKTMAQCVEYYYTWKKILRFGRKHRTRLADVSVDSVSSPEEEDCEMDNDDDDDDHDDDHDDVHDHDKEVVYELEEDKKSENEELCEMQNSPENEELCEMQNSPEPPVKAALELPPAQILVASSASFICEMPNCGAMFSSRQALNGHARIHGGTNQVLKTCSSVSAIKQKTVAQTGCHSIKSSPAHSTASGETDPTTVFPCRECGKVFFKIKSRNAHMKTHRQQEEQQRQKAQKAAMAAEMAATIARTKVPKEQALISLDHLSLMRHMEHEFEDSVAQDLRDVMDEVEVMAVDFLLEDDDANLLQCDAEL